MFSRLVFALFLAHFTSSVMALSEKLEENVPKCFVEDVDVKKLDEGKRIFLERTIRGIMKASANLRTEEMIREMMYNKVASEERQSGIGLSAIEIANIAGDCFVAEVDKIVSKRTSKLASRGM